MKSALPSCLVQILIPDEENSYKIATIFVFQVMVVCFFPNTKCVRILLSNKKEEHIHVTTWISLKNIMPSKRSCIIPLIENVHKRQMYRQEANQCCLGLRVGEGTDCQ